MKTVSWFSILAVLNGYNKVLLENYIGSQVKEDLIISKPRVLRKQHEVIQLKFVI